MKAVVISGFGGPEVLELRELPDPEPGPHEVVVRLDHAALNHLDLDVRNGVSGSASAPLLFAPAVTVPDAGSGGRICAPGSRRSVVSAGAPMRS